MTASDFTRRFVNLADPRLGAEVTSVTDDFFAPKDRMIDPGDPVFVPGKYDDHGKWMDGWESRRKRTPGHDHAVIRLGQPAVIQGANIDTRHFTGNYPPAASLQGCRHDGDIPDDDTVWTELLARVDLRGDSQHLFDIESDEAWTHVRLNIFPDGGIARLRLYGFFHIDWSRRDPRETIDLLAVENGGRPIFANNEHFGILANIMAPGKGTDMGDGWETRRRREPGNDWAVVALGHAGTIEDILVDTAFFKGNYPSHISLQALLSEKVDDEALAQQSHRWHDLLAKTPLTADAEHRFKPDAALGPVSHVRINIFPDGGISRLRLFGKRLDPKHLNIHRRAG